MYFLYYDRFLIEKISDQSLHSPGLISTVHDVATDFRIFMTFFQGTKSMPGFIETFLWISQIR